MGEPGRGQIDWDSPEVYYQRLTDLWLYSSGWSWVRWYDERRTIKKLIQQQLLFFHNERERIMMQNGNVMMGPHEWWTERAQRCIHDVVRSYSTVGYNT